MNRGAPRRRDRLVAQFPHETRGIDKYVKLVDAGGSPVPPRAAIVAVDLGRVVAIEDAAGARRVTWVIALFCAMLATKVFNELSPRKDDRAIHTASMISCTSSRRPVSMYSSTRCCCSASGRRAGPVACDERHRRGSTTPASATPDPESTSTDARAS